MTDRVEISKKLVMINSASSLLTRLISISVLVWLQQYLLTRITPEEYSLLPLLYALMMFAPLITTILTSGLGRYIVEAYAKGDDRRVTQIVSSMFPILCAAGLLFLTCGWTFSWHIDKILTIAPERVWDARVMMGLLMLDVAVGLPLAPFTCGFFVRQKFVLQNLVGIGVEVFRLSLLFTLLFGVSTRVLWVVTASVCAGILGKGISLFISRRIVPTLRFRRSHINLSAAKELTRFGGWNFIASVAGTIRTSADPILLNAFGTAMDVTCYHIGSMPLRQLESIFSTVRGPLDPVLTAMYAAQRYAALAGVYLRGGRIALWASLFFAIPCIIYSKQLITLYVGEKYLAAAIVMALLLNIFPLVYGNTMLSQLVRASGHMKPYVIRVVVMHSTNLVLTLLLVGPLQLGALGSALSTVLCFSVFHPLLMWPLARRMTQVSFIRPGLVGAILWCGFGAIFSISTWLSLALCTAGGWLGYIVCLFLFALQPEDRTDLLRIVSQVRGGFKFPRPE